MEITEKHLWARKEMLLSLGLHAFFTAIIIVFSTLTVQYPETVRILLTLDPPGGGGGGGSPKMTGETGSSVASHQARTRAQTTIHRAKRVALTTLTDSDPTLDKASLEPVAEKVVPDPETIRDTSAAAAIGIARVSAGGEGTGAGGGKGSGTGPGTGSGSGSGVGSGSGSGIGSLTGSGYGSHESQETLKKRYLQTHFTYIRDLILKNLTYPHLAKKLGWQGNVKVSFIIKEDGKVEQLRIVKSSGYDVLDSNVVDTIREVQPFPKPPVRAEIVIPVVYAMKNK